jgi:hypothetical protein
VIVWAHANNGRRFHAFEVEDVPAPDYWKSHRAACGLTTDLIGDLVKLNLDGYTACLVADPDCKRCTAALSHPEGA